MYDITKHLIPLNCIEADYKRGEYTEKIASCYKLVNEEMGNLVKEVDQVTNEEDSQQI